MTWSFFSLAARAPLPEGGFSFQVKHVNEAGKTAAPSFCFLMFVPGRNAGTVSLQVTLPEISAYVPLP